MVPLKRDLFPSVGSQRNRSTAFILRNTQIWDEGLDKPDKKGKNYDPHNVAKKPEMCEESLLNVAGSDTTQKST